MPRELSACMGAGGDTTLMVWADLDHDCEDGDALKKLFWHAANAAGIKQSEFDQVVFIFAKDRLENWIEYLRTGKIDESTEGPRVSDKDAAEAAKELVRRCQKQAAVPELPPSLKWSCQNWRKLIERMGS